MNKNDIRAALPAEMEPFFPWVVDWHGEDYPKLVPRPATAPAELEAEDGS